MKSTPARYLASTVATLAFVTALNAAPLTTEEVGDVGSFGHAALYMGAKSGFITLRNPAGPACPPAAPDTLCIDLAPPPNATAFDAPDIMTISLPKKATRTIIYPALNFFLSYQLKNETGPRHDAEFRFTALVTIESDALIGVVSTEDGHPYDGKLTDQFSYVYIDNRSMDTLDRQRTRITLARVGNAGINKEQVIAQGVPASAAAALFAGPMKVRMSVSGNALLATDVSLTANMRLFGD
jgi:hypothetical protein